MRYGDIGKEVDSDYTMDVLSSFMKSMGKKRPALLAFRWKFHWENVPVPKARVAREYLAKR